MAKPIHIGCSGWNYGDWKDEVYGGAPQRRWLELYAERFATTEINNTFYRLPTEKAVSGWAEGTPENFVFAVKASRYLTHIKRLREVARPAKRFFDAIRPLTDSGKVGAILWQFPENFRNEDDRLANALPELPEGRHAFEFRHESWFVPEVYELLREHGVALVIGHHPDRPFQAHEITADFTYVRFHYGGRGRGGNYSQAELETWIRRIAQWRRKTEVFAYFNNDWQAFAPRNAQLLAEKLGDG